MSIDAHQATAATDIYSLGQVIGWILTGQWPQPNVAPRIRRGPWRAVVKAATKLDPVERPQSIDEFLELVSEEVDESPTSPGVRGEELLNRVDDEDEQALVQLFALAQRHTDNYELYIDVLPRLTERRARAAVRDNPSSSIEIAMAIASHLERRYWGDRSTRSAERIIELMLFFAKSAVELDDLDLLEEAVNAMFKWDARWTQSPLQAVEAWLCTLSGDASRIVASTLRRHPQSSQHYVRIAMDRRLDAQIRDTILNLW